MLLNNGLPAVPVHDVEIHPTANHLLIGTHGRSIYLADITEIQQLNADNMDAAVMAFDLDQQRASNRWGSAWASWAPALEPEMQIPVYTGQSGSLTMTLQAGDVVLVEKTVDATKGMHYIDYDMTIDPKQSKAYAEWLGEQSQRGLLY